MAPSRVTFAALVAALLAALALGGCPSGLPEPAPVAQVEIPGGTFRMGQGNAALADSCGDTAGPEIQRCESGKTTNPEDWLGDLSYVPTPAATVGKIYIDQFEVSNAHFRFCVEKGVCTPPTQSSVRGIEYFGNESYDDHPVVNVTRAQAAQYCEFVGKRLPTEAEWEHAARIAPASSPLFVYPWNGATASSCTPDSSFFALQNGCRPDDPPPALNYSEADKTATFKLYNMASGVAEWVQGDWDVYAYCEDNKPYPAACQNQGVACAACQSDGELCAQTCQETRFVICKAGTYRVISNGSGVGVIRGGSYLHSRCFHRLFVRQKAKDAGPEIGFRCVSDAT